MLKAERMRNNTPLQNTAPKATSHGTFMPITAEKVKKALSPIPGATSTGFRAYQPIIKLLKNDTSTVAVNTPLKGMPAWLSTEGFTTII